MKNRLRYLCGYYLTTLFVFFVAKMVFMLCNGAGHDVHVVDYFAVVWHGLTLDASTALYFLIVPYLLSMISIWHILPKWLFRVYSGIVALAFSLAFVADTSLYPFWNFKLDAVCLTYLSTPTEAMASVSVGYLVWRFLLLVVTAIIIYCLYDRIAKQPTKVIKKGRLEKTIFSLLLIPVMVIGIRGGVRESTTNIGQVYYSENQFLNHSAVNPVFSFLYSLSHQLDDLSQYTFFDEAQCQQLVQDVYTTESVLTDILLNTTRPHIVVILMESASELFADAMPHLQQLKNEGIYFERCYGNSWRTDRGTVCALSGYPSFPSFSVMKIPEKSRTLPSIARTLKAEGYATSYLYGGDINFTNMRSYLISTGWDKITSMDDYSREQQNTSQWGVQDEITFETLYSQITSTPDHAQPHLWGYSTLSSHEPWDVPTKVLDDEVKNAFHYLDACLFQFVEKLKRTPQWDNLLIVLVADHGINYQQVTPSTPLQKNHIPLLWLGGAVKEARRVETLCNQSDLPATLLGQLQLSHADYPFSRDVLSATYQHPTAVHNFNNAQWLYDASGEILYDFDAERALISNSTDAAHLLNVNKAILQTTSKDLLSR